MTGRNRREWLVVALVVVATAALEFPSVLSPRLFYDDFEYISESWDWAAARRNLWVPHNEHAMPLGRLLVWALVRIDASVDTLPLRCSLQGPLAAALAAGLVYVFVRREWGRPAPALLATILYGVTLKYQEAVYWYAASFWILGLDTMLLALIAAQRWRQSGRFRWLAVAAFACALAPGWYAGGVLAGPLCALYLLPQPAGSAAWRGRGAALVPALGTLVFLALSLPQNLYDILHAQHYGGRSALDTFDPIFGLTCAGRAVVDILFFNPTGEHGGTCPTWLVPPVLAGVIAIAAWWNRRGDRRVILLAAGLIVGHYVLTFSPRSAWSYAKELAFWSRYHLVPWLGMVLLVVNGFAARHGWEGALSRRGAWKLALLATVLFAVQGCAAWLYWGSERPENAEQRAVLRRVAAVDRRCGQLGISADDARNALEPLELPYNPSFNAWNWLRGSDSPRPHPPEEVKRLLGD